MKKKVLLSSIATIALCLCLIAGSTFALFTSQSKVNISVTSGTVEMAASIADLELYSVKAADENATETVEDEKGNAYVFDGPLARFTNGGTAVFENAVLTMTNITPGDMVTFSITGANTSNVSIQYRYIIECTKGYTLMSGLTISVNGAEYESMSSYTSAWAPLEVDNNIEPVDVSIVLPVDAGNEYQTEDTEIRVLVEAVQYNAVVEDNVDPIVTYIEKAATAEDVNELLQSDAVDYIFLIDDMMDVQNTILLAGNVSNKVIDANGHNALIQVDSGAVLENVEITNLIDDAEDANIAIQVAAGAKGDLTVSNSVFKDAKTTWGGIRMNGNGINLTVDTCEFDGGKYGVYSSGGAGNIAIYNTSFAKSVSWAVLLNGTVKNDATIDNCVFNKCTGIFKASIGGGEGNSGLIDGSTTFTNNTMVNCTTNNGKYADTKTAGTITFVNNSLNSEDNVEISAMLGMN